jgi:prepilin-type N-terminal cleavage/methylation domain-containing protein
MKAGNAGLTLVELILSMAIMGLVTAGLSSLMLVSLQAYDYGNKQTDLHLEAMEVMDRLTSGVRHSTLMFIPNAHKPTRPMLSFSGDVNNDTDNYFGDPLFPKIDEDGDADMGDDKRSGLKNVDDNGNNLKDEGVENNDDEDLLADEDPINGKDDDNDGNFDEDPGADWQGDNAPGLSAIDDNGNGAVDDGNSSADDDEDGSTNEDSVDPVTYELNGTQLIENLRDTGSGGGTDYVVSDKVTQFSVLFEGGDATHAPRYRITLRLTDDGRSVTLVEYAYPRNSFQKTGRRCL